MQPKIQTSAPPFFGVCLSTKPTDRPIVSFYRAIWLVPNATDLPKPTLSGIAYYFVIDGAKCTVVTEQLLLDCSNNNTDERRLAWVQADNVPSSLGGQAKQLYAGFDYVVRLSTKANNKVGVVVNHSVLFESGDPRLEQPIQDALAFYGVALSTNKSGHPEVVFYRSVWRSATRNPTLNGLAYYFRFEEGGFRAVTNPFLDGEVSFFLVYRTDKDRRLDEVCLDWVLETDPPTSLVDQVQERFILDGLEAWSRDSNAYGLIDETAFRKSIFTGAVIDDRVFFLKQQPRDLAKTQKEVPDLLVLVAKFISLRSRELWCIDAARVSPYYLQTLDKTSLSALGTKKAGKPVLLLSLEMIIEHCARYAEELTKALVYAMLEAELREFADVARSRVSGDLHGFTYGGAFTKQNFSDYFQFPWLAKLLGGLGRQHRNAFYAKVEENTSADDVKTLCEHLKLLRGADEENSFEPYSGLIGALEKDFSSTKSQEEHFLFLFEFLGKDFLVGLSPTELPSAANADIPQLDLAKLNPVLLKTDLGNRHLGIFYKRVATIRACVSDYLIGDDLHLRVAEFKEDVTKQHLLNYGNGLLKDVLRSRTPFHERRLLQRIGVSCRQALGDTFHHRMSAGVRPIMLDPKRVDRRTFQSRDEVVLEEVEKYQSLEKNLQAAVAQEALESLLCDEKTHYNLFEQMAILRKIATYHRSLSQTVFSRLLKQFTSDLESRGHFLAARLSETVLGLSGTRIDTEVSKKWTALWVHAFWEEIADCFPDAGPDWSRFKARAYIRYNDGFREQSVYTLFVLSCMFDRQITTFYEPFGKFTMPYDPMVWAVNSVHRLQMFSALLPMCCGDWVCTPEHSQPDNANSRRLLWNYRLAALPKPANNVFNGGGRVPDSDTDKRLKCLGKDYRHAQTGAALWSVGTSLHFDELVLNRIIQKMGWWFNGLLDESLHHHFRCKKCGRMLVPRTSNTYFNWFSCSDKADGHDGNVYLSWCLDPSCDKVVDSREDLKQCANGKFICKCGSCCRSHQSAKPATSKNLA